MARLVLALSGEASSADGASRAELLRLALLDACREHAESNAEPLHVAQLPHADALPSWLPAHEWAEAARAPSSSAGREEGAAVDMVAQARALAASAPAGATLHIVWLLPPGGPAPLHDNGADPLDPVGAAVFCAKRGAARVGCACTCTLVASDDDTPHATRATERWAALLEASPSVSLPSDDAAASRVQLAELIDGGRHWEGSLSLHGSTLGGLALRPLPSPLDVGETAGAPSAEMPTKARLDPKMARSPGSADSSAEASEAPAAGCGLELVRAVRLGELPRHLCLPHLWRLTAARGSHAARSFLRGWCEEVGSAAAGRGGVADALLVRSTGSDRTLLLVYPSGDQVLAQLCAPPDSLAGALRFVRLEGAEGDAASQAEWVRSLPLDQAKQLLASVQAATDGEVGPAEGSWVLGAGGLAWSEEAHRALRQTRCLPARSPVSCIDPTHALALAAPSAGTAAAADVAMADVVPPQRMPPPPSRRRSSDDLVGGGGMSAQRHAPAGRRAAAPKGLGGLARGRQIAEQSASASCAGTASSADGASASAAPPPAATHRDGQLGDLAASSGSLGLRMRDAVHALRRVSEGAAREEQLPAEAPADQSVRAALPPGSEEIAQYEAPVRREHGSLLCMLLEPGRLDFAAHSTLRHRALAAPAAVSSDNGTSEHDAAVAPPSELAMRTLSSGSGGRSMGSSVAGSDKGSADVPRSRRGSSESGHVATSTSGGAAEAEHVPRVNSTGRMVAPSINGSALSSARSDDAAHAAHSAVSREPLARVVHARSKQVLKRVFEPLAETDDRGARMLAADWTAPLAELEARVIKRLETTPAHGGDDERLGADERAETVARAVRAELIEVLREGLRPATGRVRRAAARTASDELTARPTKALRHL